MKLKIDKEADALYLYLDDSEIVMTKEVAPGFIVNFNEENQAVGFEVLHLSKRSKALDLSSVEFDSN